MKIKQFEIWIADLNPQIGTEPGKVRPVLVVQSDLLNNIKHPSTLICPITTQVQPSARILRVHLPAEISKLNAESDVMIDQLRAIDNKRLLKKISQLPEQYSVTVAANLATILETEF